MKLAFFCVVAATLVAMALSVPVLVDDDLSLVHDEPPTLVEEPPTLEDIEDTDNTDNTDKRWSWSFNSFNTPVQCPANQYLNNGRCTLCPLGASSFPKQINIYGCVCRVNTYLDVGTKQCKSCPTGLATIAGIGEWAVSGCGCPADKYMEGSSCKSCPTGTTTFSAKSTSASDCRCPANQYKDGNSCKSCPTGATSSAGSTSASACRCPAHQYSDGSSCKSCPANQYSDGSSCKSCPTGTFSSAASTSPSDCGCPANQYKDGNSCKSCPTNLQFSLPGSTRPSACKFCPANHYQTYGSGQCEACPFGFITDPSQDTPRGKDSCKCPVDHYQSQVYQNSNVRYTTLTCKACPSGTSTKGRIGADHLVYCT